MRKSISIFFLLSIILVQILPTNVTIIFPSNASTTQNSTLYIASINPQEDSTLPVNTPIEFRGTVVIQRTDNRSDSIIVGLYYWDWTYNNYRIIDGWSKDFSGYGGEFNFNFSTKIPSDASYLSEEGKTKLYVFATTAGSTGLWKSPILGYWAAEAESEEGGTNEYYVKIVNVEPSPLATLIAEPVTYEVEIEYNLRTKDHDWQIIVGQKWVVEYVDQYGVTNNYTIDAGFSKIWVKWKEGEGDNSRGTVTLELPTDLSEWELFGYDQQDVVSVIFEAEADTAKLLRFLFPGDYEDCLEFPIERDTIEPVNHLQILSVDYPFSVEPGEEFAVNVEFEYDFSKSTAVSIGIFDIDSDNRIDIELFDLEGRGTEIASFVFRAPDEEMVLHLSADGYYQVDDIWVHDEEGWYEDFNIEVKSSLKSSLSLKASADKDLYLTNEIMVIKGEVTYGSEAAYPAWIDLKIYLPDGTVDTWSGGTTDTDGSFEVEYPVPKISFNKTSPEPEELKIDVIARYVKDEETLTTYETLTVNVGQQQTLHGIIFDDLGNKYEDLTVHLYLDGVKKATTWTDHNGYYEFTEINGQPITLPLQEQCEIRVNFTDRDHVFEIRDIVVDMDNPVIISYPLPPITTEQQLEYNIVFHGEMEDDPDTFSVREQYIDEIALIYHYTNIAKKFYQDKLNYWFIHTPVYIEIESENEDLAYFKATNNPLIKGKTDYITNYPMIYYDTKAAKRTSEEAPINREFHEFAHYIMWDLYGTFPKNHFKYDPSKGWILIDKNHGNFKNHCSSDSYVEGFAEFMALVTNKETKTHPPETSILPDFAWSRYPVGNSKNYVEYNINQISDEEFSIAGILWDLYDGVETLDEDNVKLSLSDLWTILSWAYVLPDYYRYNPDTGQTEKLDETTKELRYISYVKDLYDALIEKAEYYNYTSTDINTLFISHKIYNDANKDGKWQPGEQIGVNFMNSKDRRKRPVDESKLLTIDITEELLPIEVKVTTTHTGSYSVYDHEYTVTLTEYPAQLYVVMPPEKYTPTMQIETIKQGYVDSNPLTLTPETYIEQITNLGNLGIHTPGLDANASEYVVITDVESPVTVGAGEKVTLTVTMNYSFNEITLIDIGIYDYGTETYLFEETYWVEGTGTEDYVLQFKAPSQEGVLDLEVSVLYLKEDMWVVPEDDQWYRNFTIEVTNPGIPGYPLAAIITGIILYVYLGRQLTRRVNSVSPAKPV